MLTEAGALAAGDPPRPSDQVTAGVARWGAAAGTDVSLVDGRATPAASSPWSAPQFLPGKAARA